ncbi:hypothetical protein [Streptomyces zaomyceticus]|uniref:hypothetical protein n=1 Tax=Streptomyces zaomyceticus TaxID=68286 RepID=UPI0032479E8A
MESQKQFLVKAWWPARKRLRREINRRANASPLKIELPALRVKEVDLWNYAGMAKGLDSNSREQGYADPWNALESMARESLVRAVDAFNFLEDTDLSELAHQHAHEVAALVCGIFGCRIEYSDGSYWDACRLSLMHKRVGMSAGFTAARRCSICEEDIDLCPHLLDTRYEVRVERSSDGTCSICGRINCSHGDGELALVYPHPVMDEGRIHEVTLVRRPRDPLARITKLELDAALLARTLGGNPDGRDVWCHRCLHPCAGFKPAPMG